jgi:outer membrane protein TolC
VVVANIEALLVSLRRGEAIERHRLAVLVGSDPGGFVVTGQGFDGVRFPALTEARDAGMLSRRLDIRRAESLLQAAHFDVGIAPAALFPRICLAASGALSGNDFNGPSDLLISAIGSLAQPIFQGGSLWADVRRSEGRPRELVASYVQSTLIAARETNDALVGIARTRQREAFTLDSERAAARALEIASAQWKVGRVDYQPVLDSQRTLLSARDSRISATADTFVAYVALYRALGGGFHPSS